jgi:hypothetical protein
MQYREAKTIHLVIDNLHIHRRKSLSDAFGIQMGTDLGALYDSLHPKTRQLAQPGGNRRMPDLKGLRREIRSWNRPMNHDQVKD